jgi:hypothetical protein
MSDTYELSLRAFDAGEARDKLRAATEVVLSLEKIVAVAGEESADAEAFYRAELAKAFRGYREAGNAVEASTTMARGDCAPLSRERDSKATALKLGFERLEDARDTRRSLWRLVEWSRDLAVASAHRPENVPADRWP